MPGIREEYDADLVKDDEPTEYVTAQNQFDLPCGVCGKLLYVNRETLDAYEKAFAQDLDNQFICADCEQDYEDAAYE